MLTRLRAWLIERERTLRYVVVVLLAVVFVVQWVRAGLRLEDGDFYLHWQFARRFLAHGLLYADGLHIPYPPFWAMAWSPVALLPLAAAKLSCYPMSAAALGLLLYLLNRLTQPHWPLSNRTLFWTTAAVLLILARFLVRELPECGPNLFLLTLCWLAIFLWTQRRDLLAGGCLGLAIALKCTPGLLLAYFAWKRQWKLAASAATAALACALAPTLWQGPADYAQHAQIWLTHLRLGAGQADPSQGVLGPETLQNLSLRPAIARGLMRLPAGHVARLDHPWYLDFLDLSPAVAGWIAKLMLVGLLAAVAWIVRGPVLRRDDPIVLWECAAVGVLALLLSPITWYQHCVALVPPFYLLARSAAARGRMSGGVAAVAAMFVIVHVVLSRGLIGRDLTLLMASYHLTTWTLVAALLATLGGRAGSAGRCGRQETISELYGRPRWRWWLGQSLSDAPAQAGGLRKHFAPENDLRFACSWTGVFLIAGLVLRLYHYLRCPSLWHDEAALVVNVLEKSFGELLGPLRFSEAAPPLFLWIEKAASLTLGESLFALRLAPCLASCAALVLFVWVARRMLAPAAVPWATLLFATSDRLLWHACEAKQYGIEELAAVLLLVVYERTRDWSPARRSLAFALLAPLILSVAYPGCFLYGAVLLVLLAGVWRAPRPAAWLAYGVLAATALATFALLLLGPIRAQRDPTIVDCWQAMRQFPDWHSPVSVPGWLLRSTFDLFGYCAKPLGEWLAPLAGVGGVVLWKKGRRDACALLVAPIALAALAACLKAYPYGGMRVMVYAAPAVLLLVAAGVPLCLAWLQTKGRLAVAPLVLLLALPAARAGYHVVVPWQRADCATAAHYVATHCGANDAITANHWEYLYYFRDAGGRFSPIETLSPPTGDRLWVVVTGAQPDDRQPCLAPFDTPTWQTLDRREFDRTTVLLVQRRQLASGKPAHTAR